MDALDMRFCTFDAKSSVIFGWLWPMRNDVPKRT